MNIVFEVNRAIKRCGCRTRDGLVGELVQLLEHEGHDVQPVDMNTIKVDNQLMQVKRQAIGFVARSI